MLFSRHCLVLIIFTEICLLLPLTLLLSFGVDGAEVIIPGMKTLIDVAAELGILLASSFLSILS